MSDKPKGYTVDCPTCDDRAWLPGYGPNGSEAPGGIVGGLLSSSTKSCLCENCGTIPVDQLNEKDQKRLKMHKIQTIVLIFVFIPIVLLFLWFYFKGEIDFEN